MSPDKSDAGPGTDELPTPRFAIKDARLWTLEVMRLEAIVEYSNRENLEAANLPDADSATKSDSNGDDRVAQPISTASGPTTCSVCQSTFRRPEHLKRHFRSHTKEKPFECNQCGRHFSRTDTLHRHELSHHTLGSEGGKDRTHRITVKTFRACFKCAVARVRCSGGDPCGRCENRSLECQYPTERRSKAKGRKEVSQDSLSIKNEVSYEQPGRQIPSPSMLETGGNITQPPPQGPGYEVGQFQVQLIGPAASSSSSTISAGISSTEPTKRSQNGRQDTQYDPGASEPPNASKPLHSYEEFNALQAYPRMSTSNIRSVPSTSNPRPRGSSEATNIGTSVQTAVANSHQAEMALARPFLDKATLSAMNWYPNDMLLGAVNETSSAPEIHPQVFQTAPTSGTSSQISFITPVVHRSIPENAVQRPFGRPTLGTDAESPEFSVNGSDRSWRPQSETSNPNKRAADHASNASLRLTKHQRRRNPSGKIRTGSAGSLLDLHKEDVLPRFSFPMLEETIVDVKFETEATGGFKVEKSTYDSIYESFRRLCCAENSLYQKFESANFPSAETLSSFITLFFASFQPIYPILHRPTFNSNTCHWLVTLAVTAIGCQYARPTERDRCAQALHEFLRRAISVEKEKHRLCETPLWLLQAACLNCIGLLHGRSERSGAAAFSSFSDLVNLAMREKLLVPSSDISALSNAPLPEQQWSLWIEDELRRRTAYLIWLVDCTLAYHFDHRPMLCLDDGQALLPAHEELWQAKSAVEWRKLYDQFSTKETPSLYDAALIMYIEKNIIPWAGEFSQILIIHALYHRMWEVGDYFRRPLSFWNPTAMKQSRDSAIPSGSVWLPGIPSYSKWRNSACDSLDILHWSANSTIAQAGGHEHPPVLHLHEARIILLSPFHEIRTLATSLCTGKVQWEDHEQTIEWHHIVRWIRHDQYKARLAVIHSGKTLHSVRRYSTNAFHEPVAVFLATLTLWTYGLCHTMVLAEVNSGTHRPNEPPSIQLDSPCDDELVQAFVREGHAMKAIVTDVGDICGPHGPERTLQVGCEALAALSSWGISKRLQAVLKGLEELSSQ